MTLHKVPFGNGVLRRREPLDVSTILVPCDTITDYVEIYFQDVGMIMIFHKDEDLLEAMETILVMKWKRYALGNPDKMTPLAKRTRERLLETYVYEENGKVVMPASQLGVSLTVSDKAHREYEKIVNDSWEYEKEVKQLAFS